MPSVSPQKSVVLELEKSSTAVISPAPSVAVIPEAPSLAISQTAGPCSPAAIQFPARQGHWYEVQATTDLRNWCSIWQSGTAAADGSMQFTDPDAKSFALRFYRLVAH